MNYIDINLFYSNKSKFDFVSYTDSCYLSDQHKPKSQTHHRFTCRGVAIL